MGTFLINLVVSQLLNGSIEAMWNLLNILQVINLLPLLSLYFPPNVTRMFGFFAFANAESDTMQNLFEDYVIDGDNLRRESYSPRFEELGYESTSILINSGSQLFLSGIILIVYPLVFALSKVEATCFKCCSCVRNFEQAYRFNMFYRGLI